MDVSPSKTAIAIELKKMEKRSDWMLLSFAASTLSYLVGVLLSRGEPISSGTVLGFGLVAIAWVVMLLISSGHIRDLRRRFAFEK